MGAAVTEDGIMLPGYVSRDRENYSATCEKFNQSIVIVWRKVLEGNVMPSIPQEIVQGIYGAGMDVQPTQSRNWSYNAVMKRGEEVPVLSDEVSVQSQENRPVARGFNEALRESSEIMANVDIPLCHIFQRRTPGNGCR
jgi:hypothetical protein